MMDKKISIILSTYNEASIIKTTVNEIFSNLENSEIILVDDNSIDGTIDKLKDIQNKNLKIFSRKSRGLASAFLLGMINTSGDYIGWTDSNMPQLIPHFKEMVKKLETYDVVLLSRYVDGGGDKRSNMRILSSKIINSVCRIFLGSEIKDYTSSIFLMKRDVLMSVVPISTGHGEFFIEFLYKALKSKKKIIELPYTHPPDVEGMSKTAPNVFRFIRHGLNYIIRIFQSILKRD